MCAVMVQTEIRRKGTGELDRASFRVSHPYVQAMAGALATYRFKDLLGYIDCVQESGKVKKLGTVLIVVD